MSLMILADFSKLDAMIGRLRGKPVRIVHDGVSYGVYQEFGTSRGLAPRPAAQTAASEIEPAYDALMKQITEVADPDAAIEKIARDFEGRWKQQIITMRIIDTGAYLNSISVSTVEQWGGGGDG
jgi:hypothetical protein